MTEAKFYSQHLRRALYRPPEVQLFRVEDYGVPDVLLVTGGVTYYLELKVLPHLPVREDTPFRVKTTVEQRRTMQQINETMPNRTDPDTAFVLVAVAREKRWFLLRADSPTEIDMSDLESWTILSGSFDELWMILSFINQEEI